MGHCTLTYILRHYKTLINLPLVRGRKDADADAPFFLALFFRYGNIVVYPKPPVYSQQDRQKKERKKVSTVRATAVPFNAGLKPVSEEPVPPFYSRKILFKNFPARFTTTICTTSRFMPSCRRFRHAKLSAGRVPIQSIVKSDNCHASLTLTHIHLQCKSA